MQALTVQFIAKDHDNMLNAPSITKASLAMTMALAGVDPSIAVANLPLPLNFGPLTILEHAIGSYVPANDTQTIYTFSATDYQATFMYFKCDQNVVLLCTDGSSYPVFELPIDRVLMLHMKPLFHNLQALALIGAIGGGSIATPMQQGVKVNWELWLADGSLT